MAVVQTSALSPTKSSSKSRKRSKPSDASTPSVEPPSEAVASPRKRTKSPGVRVVGGRIYDSEKGTTCHQCRQKTMDFTASCKQMRKDKPCTVKFCYKCLLNRYGESAEEVEQSGNWSCPKCRDVCNCSFCMKKKGQQPTGIMIHAAKATGFSSVHDLLDKNGADVLSALDGLKSLKGANSPLKEKVPKTIKKSRGKENHNNEQKENEHTHNSDEISTGLTQAQRKIKVSKIPKRSCDQENLNTEQKENELANSRNEVPKELPQKQAKTKVAKKLKSDHACGKSAELVGPAITEKKTVRKDLKDYLKPVLKDALANADQGQILVKEASSHIEVKPMQQIPQKQSKKEKSNLKKASKGQDLKEVADKSIDEGNNLILENSQTDKVKAKQYMGKCKTTIIKKEVGSGDVEMKALNSTNNVNVNDKHLAKLKKSDNQVINTDIKLPKGMALIEVGGAEWPLEVIGLVLQFLEFCNAFSKVLDVKKGEPEYYLRDMTRGRRPRRGVNSPIISFITKLISVIQEDMDEKSIPYSIDREDSWLSNIVKFISQPVDALKKFEFENLPKNPSAFDSLEPPEKLKVLNFLCDEALQTEKLRNWIEEENSKYVERKKETQKMIFEAKKKGNDLKKKLKDDVAKALLSVRDGTSLSIEEQSKLLSQIKEETEKVHAEMLETTKLLPKIKQRHDAVRSDPLLCEEGHVFWELEGYCNTSKILLQEVGSLNSTDTSDRWFSFDEEQEKVIEQHISITRHRQQLAYRKFLKEYGVRDSKNQAGEAATSPENEADEAATPPDSLP